MTNAYPDLWRSALGMVLGVMAKGRGLNFPGDAALDAVESGLHAIATGCTMRHAKGRMAGSIKRHLWWESTHGVVGAELLRKRYHEAAEGTARDLARHFLPSRAPEGALDDLTTEGTEDAIAALGERATHEAVLDRIEREYRVNLDKVRALLSERRPGVRGKLLETIERDIKIFERRLQGYSFREIATEFDVHPAYAQRAYTAILDKMRAVAEAERRERGESPAMQAWEGGQVSKALRLDDVAQDRLLRALARHMRAVQMGFPVDFVNSNRHLLADLLLDAGQYL